MAERIVTHVPPATRAAPSYTIVTGGAGWLGGALLRALNGRTGTRALVQTAEDARAVAAQTPTVDALIGDLRSPSTLETLFDGAAGADVFHLAAIIHARGATQEVFDVNVGGTALMLDRARRTGARRFIYLTSSSPFGHNAHPDEVFDEDAPYEPFGAYGRSKMEAEGLVRHAGARGDIETVIVRCPWFYGPRQPPRQTRFFKLVRRGVFPLTGSGGNKRSLAYVDNIVQGLLLAELVAGALGRSYWIADERPYTFGEIIDAVREALRSEEIPASRVNIRLPGLVSEMAYAVDAIIDRRGRYVEPLHVLAEVNKTIACTVERAKTELGYEPEIGVAEGMRRSVRWCVENGVSL